MERQARAKSHRAFFVSQEDTFEVHLQWSRKPLEDGKQKCGLIAILKQSLEEAWRQEATVGVRENGLSGLGYRELSGPIMMYRSGKICRT